MSRLSIGGALDAHTGRVPDAASLAVVSRVLASRLAPPPPPPRLRVPGPGPGPAPAPVPASSSSSSSSIVVSIVAANDTFLSLLSSRSPRSSSRVSRLALDARDNDLATVPDASSRSLALSERVSALGVAPRARVSFFVFPSLVPSPVASSSRGVARDAGARDGQHLDHMPRAREGRRGSNERKKTNERTTTNDSARPRSTARESSASRATRRRVPEKRPFARGSVFPETTSHDSS